MIECILICLENKNCLCCVCRAKKVVVQGTNVAHLLELQALAMSLSLPTYLVQDAGLTQVRRGICLSCCHVCHVFGQNYN